MPISPGNRPVAPLIANRYKLLRELGSGGSGVVYLARDLEAHRPVALKLLRSDRIDPGMLESLQSEFRAIVPLHHPHIARAYDFGYTDDGRRPYYTREYVEGVALAPGPPPSGSTLSPLEYLGPILDLLEALHHLHAHEILHLDIHAGNLILSDDASRGAVLIDFGLVKHLRGSSASPFFELQSSQPPELVEGREIGPTSDIYSVGRLLLHRLGASPEGDGRLPGEIPGWGARLTLDLERIVQKAIQDEPSRRFQSAEEFRDVLAKVLGKSTQASPYVEREDLTVGRERELGAIAEAIHRAVSGRTGLIWFHGPPGVGKSRMLFEGKLRAQLRGLRVVEAAFLQAPVSESRLLGALRSSTGTARSAPAWLEPFSVEHGASTVERAGRVAKAYFGEDGPALAIFLDNIQEADRESRLLVEALIAECSQREAEGSDRRGLALVIAGSEAPEPGPSHGVSHLKVLPVRALGRQDARMLLSKLIKPLGISESVLARLVRGAGGVPLRLHEIARELHERFASRSRVPDDLDPAAALQLAAGGRIPSLPAMQDPDAARVVRALAAMQRPADPRELARAAGLQDSVLRRILARLTKSEVLCDVFQGRKRLRYFNHPEAAASVLASMDAAAVLRIHERVIDHMRSGRRLDPIALDNLARHLKAAGRRGEARAAVLEAVSALRNAGLLQNAIRLLSEAMRDESEPEWALRYAEEISELYDKTGDHQEGVSCLEPICRKQTSSLDPARAIRLRRRLGVHYHRSGEPGRALKLFEDIEASADPERDAEELVFVYSEIAEMHTLKGELEGAEIACRKGLEILEQKGKTDRGKEPADGGRETGDAFRGRMETMLRASLGHIELRRHRLDAARREFEAAARLGRRFSATALYAYIINNLGVVYNQLNDFARARKTHLRAEKLLTRLGDFQGAIHTTCNLATIEAKTGVPATARAQLERASQLLERNPGKRPAFIVQLSRGMVEYFAGQPARAADELERALVPGRQLGDIQFVAFATIYLSECLLLCGRYGEAFRCIKELSESPGARSGIVERIAVSRQLAIEALLGRRRAAGACLRRLEELPRSSVALPEAWNDLFLAVARLSGVPCGDAGELLERALASFCDLGIPAGRRFAQVALLLESLQRGDAAAVRSRLRRVASETDGAHHFLDILERVSTAEACLFLGEDARARDALDKASGSIVGSPFLDLDWRIEYLNARLEHRLNDREKARRHLHRALHTRDLLARALPAKLRKGFLSHPRFEGLLELARRLEKPRITPLATRRLEPSREFYGLVGRSRAIRQIVEMIDRIRDQEFPVLITGETGSGKDLLASIVQRTSPRRDGPFLALHCGSVPSELFEAELFGYEAGAFTGAEKNRPGLLSDLSGGTLVLDELSALAPESQAKLLRVLDSNVVRPVGGSTAISVDVRFVATSSADLQALSARGEFRKDLLYRFGAVRIELPPLRNRKEDIEMLARHFLDLHSRRLERPRTELTAEALKLLRERDWPGNVRELETTLLRALLTSAPGRELGVEDLEAVLPRGGPGSIFTREQVAGRDLEELKRELERVYLIHHFREAGGDLRVMMKKLDVKRSALYRWFTRAGIELGELRRQSP